jgi:multiple sugar transport system substrate-binding protein
VNLRGLCWDHPRCTRPMAAATAAYRAVHPDVTVSWDARPLQLFNDQPPSEIEPGYDLLYVDHPMTGWSADQQALVPLDTVLAEDRLSEIARDSVGASYASYAWGGHQWALPVDAVTQVAAYRTDRVDEVPRSWDDVLRLASGRPGSVALPLYPSDAMCSLVSLSANASLAAGDRVHWLRSEAVEMLVDLVDLVGPTWFGVNPPALLDALTGDGPVGYVPLVFGYANLANGPLAFTDVPGIDGSPRGAVLGGAGLAVLPTSGYAEEAAAFAAWCMDTAVQRDVLLPAGAQPGNRHVWDAAADGYLRDTRESIEHAYVRPRDAWWPEFQREAGRKLTGMLQDGASARRIHSALDALADEHRDRSYARAGR